MRKLPGRFWGGLVVAVVLVGAVDCPFGPDASRLVARASAAELTPPPVPRFPLEPGGAIPTVIPVNDPLPPGLDGRLVLLQFSKKVSRRLQQRLRKGVSFPLLPFPPSIAALNVAYGASELGPVLDPLLASPKNIRRVMKTYPVRTRRNPRGRPARRRDLPLIADIYALRLAPNADMAAAIAAYAADPNVVYAEPNRAAHLLFVPNDAMCNAAQQWNLISLNANTAWDFSTGANVTVAVIDSGLDVFHPDWIGATVVGAHDFTDGTPATVVDETGHGTHVAGIIAATTNNGLGVCSLAFQSAIMPLKAFLNDTASTPVLANALLMAIANGADVINNSWGGAGIDQTIEAVVTLAHDLGLVVVNAAGNSAEETCGFYPTNVEHGMSVAAVDINDAPAVFSDFGVKIDVAAPGVDVLSTCPASDYCLHNGTSMAAPHVSALAALLIAQHPTWTNEQIKQAIRQNTIDVDLPGFDVATGYGRIDAAEAVTQGGLPPATASLVSARNCEAVAGQVPVKGLAGAGPGGTYLVEVGAGPMPASFLPIAAGSGSFVTSVSTLASWDTSTVCDGDYTLRLTASNGSVSSEDRNLVHVAHLAFGWPGEGADACMTIGGPNPSDNVVTIPGTAECQGMTQYTLEYTRDPYNIYMPVQPTATFTSQPAPGVLGTWDLTTVTDGLYDLRITANCACGLSTTTVPVIVDKHLLPGWPASIELRQGYPLKSPVIADLDGGGAEVVIGATVLQQDGTLKPNWSSFPGYGRTNSAVVQLDEPPDTNLEVVAAVFSSYFDSIPSDPNLGAPVVYAFEPDASVRWAFPVVNPVATSPGPAPPNHGIPSSISVGNVDGDGKPDVVFSVFFNWANPAEETTVFVLDGPTGALKSQFPILGRNGSITLADLNADGEEDLVINSVVAPGIAGYFAYCTLAAYRWDGTPLGAWSSPVFYPCTGLPDPIAGDVDRDGRYEILAGNVLWNHGGVAETGWPSTFSNWVDQTGVLMELNDQDPELEVVLGGSSNQVQFKMTDHDAASLLSWGGLFYGENVVPIGIDQNPGNIVAADVDGDGKAEILWPGTAGHLTGCPPLPLYKNDYPQLGAQPPYPRFVSQPLGYIIHSSAAVGDLDGDGLTDIALAAGSKVYVWGMGSPFDPANNPWPVFQHDLAHTGRIPLCNCSHVVQPNHLSLKLGTPDLGSATCTTSDGTVSGTIDDALGGTQCRLRAGGLYLGGSGVQAALPALVPAMETLVDVQSYDAVTGDFTIGALTDVDTGSTRTCSSPDCLFAAPLPVVTPDPSKSMCIVARVAVNASGTGNCNGSLSLSLPQSWDIFMDGDAVPGVPGLQPCPVCINAMCNGGDNDGNFCVPASSAVGAAYPTSHDCPPVAPRTAHVQVPFVLTTGVSEANSLDLTQQRVFCGFCADASGTFANTPIACDSNGGCPPSFPVCQQHSPGAFGVVDGRTISQSGVAPQACLGGGPHAARVVGTFCIPPSLDSTVNDQLGLPGPASVALPIYEQLGP